MLLNACQSAVTVSESVADDGKREKNTTTTTNKKRKDEEKEKEMKTAFLESFNGERDY